MAEQEFEVPSVVQGECTGCGRNYDMSCVVDHNVVSGEDEVVRELSCGNCDKTATIRTTDSGIETDDGITHENASWTENEDDEEDETL
jgi:hypothetical protein